MSSLSMIASQAPLATESARLRAAAGPRFVSFRMSLMRGSGLRNAERWRHFHPSRHRRTGAAPNREGLVPHGFDGVRQKARAIEVGHNDRDADRELSIEARHGVILSPAEVTVPGLRAAIAKAALFGTSFRAPARKPADQPKCIIMAAKPENPAQTSFCRMPSQIP